MLILSRKKQERILIDGPCVIEVTEVRGDRCRIGIHAKHGTTILREEVALECPAYSPMMQAWNAWIKAETRRVNAELAEEAADMRKVYAARNAS